MQCTPTCYARQDKPCSHLINFRLSWWWCLGAADLRFHRYGTVSTHVVCCWRLAWSLINAHDQALVEASGTRSLLQKGERQCVCTPLVPKLNEPNRFLAQSTLDGCREHGSESDGSPAKPAALDQNQIQGAGTAPNNLTMADRDDKSPSHPIPSLAHTHRHHHHRTVVDSTSHPDAPCLWSMHPSTSCIHSPQGMR